MHGNMWSHVSGITHLHDFLQLQRLIWRLQHFATDGGFLIRRASRSFHEHVALRVAANQNVSVIVHFQLDSLN
jgi:hypothetical protein